MDKKDLDMTLIDVKFPKAALDALMKIAPESYFIAKKIELGLPLLDGDARTIELSLRLVASLGRDLINNNQHYHEQAEVLKKKAVTEAIGGLSDEAAAIMASEHDCDKCPNAGSCEIEDMMRHAKEVVSKKKEAENDWLANVEPGGHA